MEDAAACRAGIRDLPGQHVELDHLPGAQRGQVVVSDREVAGVATNGLVIVLCHVC